MKSFLRTVLAVLVGLIIAQLFGLFILIGLAGAFGQDEPIELKESSVLEIDISNPIADRDNKAVPSSMSDALSFTSQRPMRLYNALEAIRKAASDPKIAGIILKGGTLGMPLPNAEELRQELLDFKESGKFILSFANNYSQGGYYLSSVADSLYMHPAGGMDWAGLAASMLYYAKTFEKFGVEPQIVRHGKFKSAVEPFMQETISEANREQNHRMLSSMWNTLAQAVAKSRNIPMDELNRLANERIMLEPQEAIQAKLVDALLYRDQVDSILLKRANTPDEKAPRAIDIAEYDKYLIQNPTPDTTSSRIAILYASGAIEDSNETKGIIGGDGFAKIIAKIRKNKDIKGVVLRVNSPGGSALASETMWRELQMLAAEKPLVVSMGEYAASGGYYISSAASKIYSNESTLTGSIGVFGMFLTYGKGMREFLGVNPQVVKTHSSSDMGSLFRPLTALERSTIQRSIENVYSTFIGRVAAGRNMTTTAVDSVGQGRVWSGSDAKQLGLVDQIGGIRHAIAACAQLAELSEYRLDSYPKYEENFMDKIIDKVLESEAVASKLPIAGHMLRSVSTLEETITRLHAQQGIRAQLPYSYEIR